MYFGTEIFFNDSLYIKHIIISHIYFGHHIVKICYHISWHIFIIIFGNFQHNMLIQCILIVINVFVHNISSFVIFIVYFFAVVTNNCIFVIVLDNVYHCIAHT